jgi:hypothetical protein
MVTIVVERREERIAGHGTSGVLAELRGFASAELVRET